MVLLGVAGAYTEAEGEANHYATKVGGHACFPGTALPAGTEELLACQACGQKLSMVLQAYAPLSLRLHGVEVPERCLYVYGCGRPGCGKVPGAWRVVRCQLPALTSTEYAAIQEHPLVEGPGTGTPAPNDMPPQIDSSGWGGFGEDDDAFFGGDAEQATDAFDFSDLNAALDSSTHAAAQQQQQHRVKPDSKAGKPAQLASTHQAPTVPTVRAGTSPGVPVLPEFYITALDEPQGVQLGIRQSEMSHIQELLLRYHQDEAAEQPGVASSMAWLTAALKPSSKADVPREDDDDEEEDEGEAAGRDGEPSGGDGRAGDSQADAQSGSDEDSDAAGAGDGEWAEEEYEEDTLRGVVPTYLKFNKRLQREPQQCVRYCWNGPLLWPRKPAPRPGTCAHCGAPRVMEMQLMAPVIACILEAADADDWAVDGRSSKASSSPYGARAANRDALIAAADWDLCTLAVFTCSQSCLPTAQNDVDAQCAVLVQEHAVLVNETECHC